MSTITVTGKFPVKREGEPGDHSYHVPKTGERGWHKITALPDFTKFQYADSPYRVVVHKNERGHFEALFTSWYDTGSYLIRGNCGGSAEGRMKALAAAYEFMEENARGCAPPRDYK